MLQTEACIDILIQMWCRRWGQSAWRSHVSVAGLVWIPNACVPLPVRRQCLRSVVMGRRAGRVCRGQSRVGQVCEEVAM